MKTNSTSHLYRVILLLLLLIGWEQGFGQISMATTGSHTQNFNALSNSTTAQNWVDNSTIANWYSQRTGNGTTYVGDTGSGTAGTLYSYGASGNTERAIGSIGSGNAAAGSFAHGVLLRNTSSSTITSLTVSYTLEQWRNGGSTTAQSITVWYKKSTTSFTALNPNSNSGWTQVTGLTTSSPINTATAAALDGNATANKASVSNVAIPSLSLAANEYIMIKWEDPDHSGTDHGISIDDVTISWTVPPVITAPGAPSITGITPGNGQLSVAFTAPSSNGGATITNYQYSVDGSTYTAVSPAQTTSPIVITGLTNGTSYPVTLKAVNSAGAGAASNSVSDTPRTTPSAPSITAITPGNGQLSVAFTAGADGGAAISNYKYSLDNGSSYTAVSPAQTTSPIVITGLTNGTSYSIRILAINAAGDGTPSAAVAATPYTTPAAPTLNSVTPGNGQLALNFSAGATNGSPITDYKYALNSGTYVSAGTTSSPIIVTGLTNGVSYSVQLRAVNAAGDGAESNAISGTPAAPSTPTISVTTLSLAPFTAAYGTASYGGSFDVSGTALNNNITISAPAGFEVSITSSSSGFATSQVLTQSGGEVAATTVYVRTAGNTPAGTASGSITLSSQDAANVSVSVLATITPKQLTITGLSGVSKTYDGTTAATVSGTAVLNGVVGLDDVALDATAASYTFASATAGTNKSITTSGFTLTGTAQGNYTLAQPTGLTADINKAASSIVVTGSASYTYNASSQGPNTASVTGSTGAVTYTYTGIDPVVAPSATRPTNAGSYTATATVAADTNFEATTSPAFNFVIAKADQTITLASTDSRTTGTAPYTLPLNASSNLPITYSSSNPSVATVSGNTVTIVGPGTTTITANQPGNANFNAAPQATQLLTVTQPACNTATTAVFWNFGTSAGNLSPTSGVVTGLTVSAISRANDISNGATFNSTTSSSSSPYSGQFNVGLTAQNGSFNSSVSGYFEVTLTPAAGYQLTLNSISLASRSTSSGPTTIDIRTSANSFASPLATASTTANSTYATIAPSFTALSTTSALTLRIYGYVTGGAGSLNSGSAINWRIDDLTINATVSNAPSTATVGANQSVCSLTSNPLGGNTPQVGTGSWSQVSGPGTTNFSSSTSGSSTATASVDGTYVYRWSINNGCATTSTADVTVTFTTPSSTTDTISACGSYTWAENGTTYTTGGTYTFVAGCVTKTLDLTINPVTANTTTISACDSFTWNTANGDGQTYTQTGTYTNTIGCHTETLQLTITPSTTDTQTVSACGSYVWTGGNGTTYTESGVYSFVNGCDTKILDLTIVPVVNNTSSETACDSYTWSVNGTTYTDSGTYTHVVGCTTETLNLTINHPAVILTQPANAQVCASTGAAATLSVAATNADTATYQWFSQLAAFDTDWTPVTDGTNYIGSTSPNLTVTKSDAAIPANGTKYRVVITTDCGSVTSDVATITDLAIPATPASLVMTNPTSATPTASVTNVSVFVGTETEFLLTATPVSGAVSYRWTLPVGVIAAATNIATGETITTDNTLVVKFTAAGGATPLSLRVQAVNSFGCYSLQKASAPIIRQVPTGPTIRLDNGLTDVAVSNISAAAGTDQVFRLTAGTSAYATSYEWTLPDGVNRVTDLTGTTITQDRSTTEPVIYVNFAGVTTANTFSYLNNTTPTYVLRLGVTAKNGVGLSFTNNAGLSNPTTTSTARLATVRFTGPAAPKSLVLNNGLNTTAITSINALIGQQGTYRLSAGAVAQANHYLWELPACVTRVSALDGLSTDTSLTSTEPFIYVKFNGPTSTGVIQFGVKAVNIVGESVTNNGALTPATTSTARLLRFTIALPTAPATLRLDNGLTTTAITQISTLIGQQGTFRLSATASALATSYLWELPTGVTRVTDLTGGVVTAATSSTTPFIYVRFTDNVSVNFLQFGVKALNSAGASVTDNSALLPATSSTARLLRLNITAPTAPAVLSLRELTSTSATTVVSAYVGTTTVLKLAAAVSPLANGYVWQLPAGVNRVDELGQPVSGFTSTDTFIYVNFADVTPAGATLSLPLGVSAFNGVGSSPVKILSVSAGLPAVASAIRGTAQVCEQAAGYDYTISPAIGAAYYIITAPAGSVVTSASNPGNTSNVLTTSDTSFHVVYPAVTAFPTTARSLTARSGNAFGTSASVRSLLLTKISCATTSRFDQAEVVSAQPERILAYPNPFATSFQLAFPTVGQDNVTVTVFDMTGKRIETLEATSEALNHRALGNDYAAGVYNVIITQGGTVRNLRVVKR